MPETEVVFYADENGQAPALEWIKSLPEKIQDKAEARILLLEETGHELRRPIADLLRDGIYELRWSEKRVNYRIIYGFAGRNRAVVLHGLTKEKAVPDQEIDRAVDRLNQFKNDPAKHSYSE